MAITVSISDTFPASSNISRETFTPGSVLDINRLRVPGVNGTSKVGVIGIVLTFAKFKAIASEVTRQPPLDIFRVAIRSAGLPKSINCRLFSPGRHGRERQLLLYTKSS